MFANDVYKNDVYKNDVYKNDVYKIIMFDSSLCIIQF